jgi:hypothetical protein
MSSTQPLSPHKLIRSSDGKSHKSRKSLAKQSPAKQSASTGETKSATLGLGDFIDALAQAKDDFEFKSELKSLSDNLNKFGNDARVTKFVTQFNVNYKELLKLLTTAQGGGGRKMKGGAGGVREAKIFYHFFTLLFIAWLIYGIMTGQNDSFDTLWTGVVQVFSGSCVSGHSYVTRLITGGMGQNPVCLVIRRIITQATSGQFLALWNEVVGSASWTLVQFGLFQSFINVVIHYVAKQLNKRCRVMIGGAVFDDDAMEYFSRAPTDALVDATTDELRAALGARISLHNQRLALVDDDVLDVEGGGTRKKRRKKSKTKRKKGGRKKHKRKTKRKKAKRKQRKKKRRTRKH